MKIMFPLIFLVLTACSGPNYETKYFKAISEDKKDTALLKIHISEDAFYGDYQIRHDDRSKDDGTISGNVTGDTLIGKFKYLSKDNVRSIDPIVFLRDGEKLKLGSGIKGKYMGFHVYARGSIYFNDSLFQFQPTESEFIDK